jgi:hypothetical protein
MEVWIKDIRNKLPVGKWHPFTTANLHYSKARGCVKDGTSSW